jgi:hypothetical protein
MIERILRNHYWGTINYEYETYKALQEIEKLLLDEFFTNCDSLVKIYDLPKEYKEEKIHKIVYEK